MSQERGLIKGNTSAGWAEMGRRMRTWRSFAQAIDRMIGENPATQPA